MHSVYEFYTSAMLSVVRYRPMLSQCPSVRLSASHEPVCRQNG